MSEYNLIVINWAWSRACYRNSEVQVAFAFLGVPWTFLLTSALAKCPKCVQPYNLYVTTIYRNFMQSLFHQIVRGGAI